MENRQRAYLNTASGSGAPGTEPIAEAHITDPTDAHDASAISSIPAGGLVATNVQTALNELDLEKVSATIVRATGVSDTAAVQAAINIGGWVHLPDTNYVFLTGLTVPADATYGLRFTGSAEGNTTLDFTALSSGTAFDSAVSGLVRNVGVADFTFLGPGIGSSVTAVKAYHGYAARNVETVNFGVGLDAGAYNGVYIDPSNEFRSCGWAITTATMGNQHVFSPRIFACTKGIQVHSSQVHIDNAWFENCLGTEIEIAGAGNVVIDGCWFESGRTTPQIVVTSTSGGENIIYTNNQIVMGATSNPFMQIATVLGLHVCNNHFAATTYAKIQIDTGCTTLRDWGNLNSTVELILTITGAGTLTNRWAEGLGAMTLKTSTASNTYANKITLPTQGSTGGLSIGGDVVIYRSAANTITVGNVNTGDVQCTSITGYVAAVDFEIRMRNNSADWRITNNFADLGNMTFQNVTSGEIPFRLRTDGRAQFRLGGGTVFASIGGTIFDFYADVGNGTTVETDLFSATIPASTLIVNAQKLEASYDGIFAATAATKQIKVLFGGTTIFDSGALAVAATLQGWSVKVRCIRVSSSVVRCAIDFQGTVASPPQYVEVTGLTLTNTQILKITGTAGVGGANNDIVAKLGTIRFNPNA